MLVLPILLVTDFHIPRELLAFAVLHRHSERERSVGGSDGATIAVGLLGETLHHLYLAVYIIFPFSRRGRLRTRTVFAPQPIPFLGG